MKRGLNIAGLVAGVVLVVVSPPSSALGMVGMVAGLALAGVNIYSLLARRKAARLASKNGAADES